MSKPRPHDAPVLLLDGGLGTTLEANHSTRFDSSTTPLWSSHLAVADPSTLLACQRSFGRVPVDVILTATYQASHAGFARTKTAEFPEGVPAAAVPRFLDEAVRAAERAVQPGARVALSVGPYGACIVPSQEYSGEYGDGFASRAVAPLRAWHAQRLAAFCRLPDLGGRVSIVALETVPRVDEIVALRLAVTDAAGLRGVPFWISCLFPGDDARLPDGTAAGEAVRAMLTSPSLGGSSPEPRVPWGIGVNCTKVWKLDAILRQYEAAVEAIWAEGDRTDEWPALVLYPDGTLGEVYDTVSQKWVFPDGEEGEAAASRGPWAEQLVKIIRDTQEKGRWRQIIVGGCCMAGPDKISDLQVKLGI